MDILILFREKNSNLNRDSNLGPPEPGALPFDGTGLNLSLESNVMQDVILWHCHHLTDELTSFILIFKSNW